MTKLNRLARSVPDARDIVDELTAAYARRFPTDVDDIPSRLDAAARVTIASHGASSDAKKITDHSTDQNKPRPVGGHLKTTADLHQQ